MSWKTHADFAYVPGCMSSDTSTLLTMREKTRSKLAERVQSAPCATNLFVNMLAMMLLFAKDRAY